MAPSSHMAAGQNALPGRRKGKRKREGVALLMSLISVAILAVLVADLHETTGTSFTAAMAERDQLKAEYLARSGVNLTKLMITQEPGIRKLAQGMVGPMLQMVGMKQVPQLPVWRFTDVLLQPFANLEASKGALGGSGYDLDLSEGLGNIGGNFSVIGTAENGKINVNKRLFFGDDPTRVKIGQDLWPMMRDGRPPGEPTRFDPLFDKVDAQGRMTSRIDVIANITDWWDGDQTRHTYDVATGTVVPSGGEDSDFYRSRRNPYEAKNAPFDSLEELRLVEGIDDDFWATFVEPSEDPRDRQLTIYGSGRLNPNQAPPELLHYQICRAVEFQIPLCLDVTERGAFISLFRLALGSNLPIFGTNTDLIKFIKGDHPLYTMASTYAQTGLFQLFTPVQLTKEQESKLSKAFIVNASMIWLEATGTAGNAKTRIKTLINFHNKWVPPKGNPGTVPKLGVFHYFRID